MMKTGLLASAALALTGAAPQDAPTPPGLGNFTLSPSAPTPTPTPTPVPVGPVITLPTLTPTPASTPRGTPTPRAAPSPRATPTPRATPGPRPAASSTPIASPSPIPTPSAPAVAPAPVPVLIPLPSPTPSVAATPAAAPAGGSLFGPILGVLFLLALLGGAALWWKRRRDGATERPAPTKRATPPRPKPAAKQPAPTPPPAKPNDPLSEAPSFWTPSKPANLPEPIAPSLPPASPPPRPQIEIGIAPRRAGLNLLSATAEVELLLRNEGDAIATGIALDVRLINAQSAQDAELGAFFAAAMGKSAVPPFEIAPGEEQSIRAVATLPRESIVPMTAADRPMFVPMMTVDVRYDRDDDSRAQTAAAFMIGIVRDGSDKLAPFWLDTSPRMYDTIAARPHSFSVRS